MKVKRRYIITFPKAIVRDPWNYELITRFDVVPNIIAGKIEGDAGILGYEIEGEPHRIDRAIAYLREGGAAVEEAPPE